MNMPSLDYEIVTESGERGWTGSWFNHENNDSNQAVGDPVQVGLVDETRVFLSTYRPKGLTTARFTLKLEGYLKPRPADTDFEFGLTVAGRAKVWIWDEIGPEADPFSSALC